jgi:hypothetical protein
MSALPAISARHAVTVDRLQPEQATAWNEFLQHSNNGTLFHDLRFLSYHPPGRFDIYHLVFYRDAELVALLPAALVREEDGRLFLKSPYGASIGGCVLARGARAETVLAIVETLQAYATDKGLAGIEMRLGPSILHDVPNDSLAFALTARGFDLTRRWLCHVIPLPSGPAEVLPCIPTRSRRRYARYALRQGVVPEEAGAERLAEFHALLEANRARHQARPTHTIGDLQAIFDAVPDRVKLFLFSLERRAIAGALVFELNPRVACLFYLCHDERFEQYRATSLAVVHVMEHYAGRAFQYLDFGPSTFDDLTLNRGLAEFKEELGATGLCRDTYRWERVHVV